MNLRERKERALLHGAYPRRRQIRDIRRRAVNVHLVEAIAATVPPADSIVDIGAGHGAYVKALRERGYQCIGIDGGSSAVRLSAGLVQWADLVDDCRRHFQSADWGLFLEVGEHVPAELEAKLIDNVASMPRTGLIASWAGHGQQGWRHVNCRSEVYVASMLARHGWLVDDHLTRMFRRRIPDKRNRHRFMVLLRSGMVPVA